MDWADENHYEGRDEEGPEAEMFRNLSEEERERMRAAEDLLSSLRPEDSRRVLWTWAQIKKYALKRIRRRRD